MPTKGASVKGDTVTLSPEARKALDVKTTPVEKRTLERSVLVPAAVVLRPEAHAFASTQLAGRVEQVRVSPGQAVQAGEMLAWIRSPELESQQTAFTTARLELELADKKLKRAEELARDQLGAPLDLLAARNQRQEKANALRIVELKLLAVGVEAADGDGSRAGGYGLLPLRAPISGVVAHLELSPGMMVDPHQHLLEIADGSRVWVRAEAPEAYVRQIAVGNDAVVRLRSVDTGQQPLGGVVRARLGKVEPKTLAEPVWIELTATEPAIAPGMAGQAQIIVERRPDALCVPESAIVRDGIETVVFVQTEPGKYDRTRVVTGLASAGWVQINAGLFAIDTVVTQGQRQLASFFVQGVLRPSPQARKTTGLKVEPVGRQTIASTIELDGVLEVPPHARSLVVSSLAGKLSRIELTMPREVKRGEPLAGVDSLEFRNLQFDLIQADLAARLHQGTLDAYRKADPEARGIVPGQLREEARIHLEIAKARLEGLSRRLLDLGLADKEIEAIRRDQKIHETLTLRSPRDGHAMPLDAVPGHVIGPTTALFEVQDRSRLWVRGRDPQQRVNQVRAGLAARVRLTADPRLVLDARVARLGSLPEGDIRVRSVWAELAARSGLLVENMLVQLTIEAEPGSEALALPVAAITRDGSQAGVFVYEEKQDRFTLRPVALGRRDDRFVEVRSGLQPGELVAITAVADLRRGYGRIK